MKLEQVELGFWEQNSSSPSSLSVSCKLLRPRALKLDEATESITSFDLNGVIKHANQKSPEAKRTTHIPVVSQSGGTRWNPTQEQIRRLEELYKAGLRTPNAHQIERIAAELEKYGRIEGKNVFYWFQNHKARERQKQKRNALLAFSHSSQLVSFTSNTEGEERTDYCGTSFKRQCRCGGVGLDVEECVSDGTLELFPLHPEWGR